MHSLSCKTSIILLACSFHTENEDREWGGGGQGPGPYRKRGGKQHRFPLRCENCESGGPCQSAWPASPLPCVSQGTASPRPQRRELLGKLVKNAGYHTVPRKGLGMVGNPYTPPQLILSLLLDDPRLSGKEPPQEPQLPHCQSPPHLYQVITEPPCWAQGLGQDWLFTPALKENPEAGPVGCGRGLSSMEDALNAFVFSDHCWWHVLHFQPFPPCLAPFCQPAPYCLPVPFRVTLALLLCSAWCSPPP